jgi:hypothetical protein
MNNITKKIVETILSNCNKGTTTVSFISETIPSMKKRNNPFLDKVIKISNVGGMIGFNYENSVNNQLNREGKEGNFKSQSRKWGVKDSKFPFIIRHTKKGETEERYYLSVKVQQTNKFPTYINVENGEEIPYESIKEFLNKSYKPSTQNNVDKEVVERDYEISNLKNISIGGKKFFFGEDEGTVTV